jgi:hypothetical protein
VSYISRDLGLAEHGSAVTLKLPRRYRQRRLDYSFLRYSGDRSNGHRINVISKTPPQKVDRSTSKTLPISEVCRERSCPKQGLTKHTSPAQCANFASMGTDLQQVPDFLQRWDFRKLLRDDLC